MFEKNQVNLKMAATEQFYNLKKNEKVKSENYSNDMGILHVLFKFQIYRYRSTSYSLKALLHGVWVPRVT